MRAPAPAAGGGRRRGRPRTRKTPPRTAPSFLRPASGSPCLLGRPQPAASPGARAAARLFFSALPFLGTREETVARCVGGGGVYFGFLLGGGAAGRGGGRASPPPPPGRPPRCGVREPATPRPRRAARSRP